MKLQMIPDLDLEKAVAAARQSEAVRQQQGVVRGDPSVVDNVDSYKKRKHVQNKGSNQKQHSSHVPIPSPAQPPRSHKCTRCGKSPVHSRQKCPAINETCHKCGKKGHYQSMCKTGKVAHVEVDSDGIDTHLEVDTDVFLGTLTVHSLSDTADKNNPWEVTIHLNGEPVLFKIDTGADVSTCHI